MEFAAVFALFALATTVIFWRWIVHPHAALIGPPEDNMNDFWNTWYVVVAHNPAQFFTTNLLRFPEGTPLIYQSFAYPQILAVLGLSHIFGKDTDTLVALQNFTLLIAFPLAGTGAFYLVHFLVRSAAGGMIGGFVFAFNPFEIEQALHHAGVSSIEFLPFFVLAYLLALERRSLAWLVAASLFLALSALSCWYYLFYCAYFIVFQLFYQQARNKAWPKGWQLLAPMLCFLCALTMLSPLLVPMMLAARPSVYIEGGNKFVADLLGFVTFPPQHLLFDVSRQLYARFTGYPWEAAVYLGLFNLAALVWVSLRTGVGRTSSGYYVFLGMLTFSILACGEALHIAGRITFIGLPDVFLDGLPFFANVRTPSRAIVFVYLFLGIGVGFAFATILQSRRLISKGVATILAALIVIDFYPVNLPATSISCTPGLEVVKADPDRGFGVLNLPLRYAEEDAYMFEQVCHHHPIVDGRTAREMSETLLYRLSWTDLPQQQKQLAQAHVKYLLLHRQRDGLYRWNKQLAPVSAYTKNYHIVYDGWDMTVLRVY